MCVCVSAFVCAHDECQAQLSLKFLWKLHAHKFNGAWSLHMVPFFLWYYVTYYTQIEYYALRWNIKSKTTKNAWWYNMATKALFRTAIITLYFQIGWKRERDRPSKWIKLGQQGKTTLKWVVRKITLRIKQHTLVQNVWCNNYMCQGTFRMKHKLSASKTIPIHAVFAAAFSFRTVTFFDTVECVFYHTCQITIINEKHRHTHQSTKPND